MLLDNSASSFLILLALLGARSGCRAWQDYDDDNNDDDDDDNDENINNGNDDDDDHQPARAEKPW